MIKGDISPPYRIMAIGALAQVVVGRAILLVAGQAVGRITMVYSTYIAPIAGVVTLGALTQIVVGRAVIQVTGNTVDEVRVVQGDDEPAVSIVAVEAHARVVVGRRHVTGLAVDQVAVVSGGALPAIDVVALGALAIIVLARGICPVAIPAIPEARMIEPVLSPVGGSVAVGAAQVIMLILAMAIGALGVALVVERDRRPVIVVVAPGAGAIIVTGRSLGSVAVVTNVGSGVVKSHRLPVRDGVAVGALAGVVASLDGMTALAIIEPRMVKGRIRPIRDGVAVGALAGIVSLRYVVFPVAVLAIVEPGVVKAYIAPVSGVGMAVCTGGGRLLHRDRCASRF
jgi:hypothetical protein